MSNSRVDFPGGSDGKESAWNAGDGFDPWVVLKIFGGKNPESFKRENLNLSHTDIALHCIRNYE